MGDSKERAERVRTLIALEVARIARDLEERTDYLVQLWSRQRTREPFLQTMFSRWSTVSFSDLVELTSETVERLEAFYEELESFRMYIRYTEDMPVTLRERYEARLARLVRAADGALEALGGAPVRPSVEGAPPPLDAPEADPS